MDFEQPVPTDGPWPAVGVEELSEATLTRVEHGPLSTAGQSRRFIRGAVYDSSRRLVPRSQRFVPAGYPWVPADGERTTRPGNAERLTGTWLYGGHWAQHFGHFLLETISTLWPAVGAPTGSTGSTGPTGYDGVVFHKYLRQPVQVENYQRRALQLLGLGSVAIEVVDRAPVVVERLVVPSRTVVPNAFVAREARTVWQELARGRAGGGGRRLYFSRTEFNARTRREHPARRVRSTPDRDRELDRLLPSLGFEVVAPEALTFDEQLDLVADAAVLAGMSGTALHLSAFAPPSARVVEIGDTRSREQALGMQLAIDASYGRPHAFVPGQGGPAELERDLRALVRRLDR